MFIAISRAVDLEHFRISSKGWSGVLTYANDVGKINGAIKSGKICSVLNAFLVIPFDLVK